MVDVRPLAQSEIDSVGAVLGLVRLDQGDGFYLVAWDGDEPLGHLHLALTDPPELQDVSVRAEHRRQGVATALVGRAEDGARARGFDRVTLFVGAENAAAQALYRRCGYADSGAAPRRVKGTIQARTGPIDVDDTLLTWEKRLTMSTHTDIVEAYMEGFRRSDKQAILALLTDDVAWDLPGFRHLTGKADFEGEIVNPQFEENPTLVVNRKVEDGDTVVCIGEGQGEMKAGGEFRFAFCDVFTFRDDLICRVESYVVPLSGPSLAQLAEE